MENVEDLGVIRQNMKNGMEEALEKGQDLHKVAEGQNRSYKLLIVD